MSDENVNEEWRGDKGEKALADEFCEWYNRIRATIGVVRWSRCWAFDLTR